MEGFASQLDAINAVADASPGFVWRFQTEEGHAAGLEPFGDEAILFNMSVWESPQALYRYTYQSQHAGFLARRNSWFTRMGGHTVVLWWIPAGHTPTVEEAATRLARLNEKGPLPEGFTFRKQFSPEGVALAWSGT